MTDTPADGAMPGLVIRPLASDAEARACATLMSSNDPWITFGRSFDESYRIIRDPAREVYVTLDDSAGDDAQVAGFTIVVMQGAFVGYIQSIAVATSWRSRGLGSALIAYAERRILREQPNVFICASSFNPRALRLYERLGYHVVGELTDFMVRGHSEILLRKTTGPLSDHVAGGPDAGRAGGNG